MVANSHESPPRIAVSDKKILHSGRPHHIIGVVELDEDEVMSIIHDADPLI